MVDIKDTCPICGSKAFMFSWEKMCASCKKEEHYSAIQTQLESNQIEETYAEDDILCPWCGEKCEEDYDALYTEGNHEVECAYCEKTFYVDTEISYSYSTKREDY